MDGRDGHGGGFVRLLLVGVAVASSGVLAGMALSAVGWLPSLL